MSPLPPPSSPRVPLSEEDVLAAPVDTVEAGAEDTPGDTSGALTPWLLGVLALVVVGGVTDLVLDRPPTWRSLHVVLELAIIVLSLSSAVVLWRGWRRAARDLHRTRAALLSARRSLGERQAERDAWRRNAEAALAGFGAAVDAQFQAWQLTPTEREVAFLLLKGYGHKQVAARTGRSERTVRQHAVAVYEKSGLGGRAELAAFFLGDLGLDAVSSVLPSAEGVPEARQRVHG